MLDCVITVRGTGVSKGYHGNTTRPVHDQTRPVHGFFKAYGSYGAAIREHVVSCKDCTPADVLPLLGRVATVKPDRIAKAFLKRDARTPRPEYLALLARDARNLSWIASNASPEELWAAMVVLDEATHKESERAAAQPALYPDFKPWRFESRKLQMKIGGQDWWKHEKRPTPLDALTDRAPQENRELVRLGFQIVSSGARLPATAKEARELLPAALVHGS